MKISQDTLAILKNFSTINSNLLVKEGSYLTTISPTKNILAEANVSETFDVEFGIAIFRRSDLVPIKPIFLLEEGKRKANLRAAYEFEAFQDKVTTGNLVSVYEMFDALCESIVEAVKEFEE